MNSFQNESHSVSCKLPLSYGELAQQQVGEDEVLSVSPLSETQKTDFNINYFNNNLQLSPTSSKIYLKFVRLVLIL